MFYLLFLFIALLPSHSLAFPTENGSNVYQQCGVAKLHADKSYIASYPWAAALFKGDRFGCTGTIIGPRHILTAAHCVYNRTVTSVKVGATDYTSAKAREYRIKSAISPEYGIYTKENDLAVLTLEEPIEFSERIAPICMDSTGTHVGEKATIAGWGVETTEECFSGGETTILHQGHVRLIACNK